MSICGGVVIIEMTKNSQNFLQIYGLEVAFLAFILPFIIMMTLISVHKKKVQRFNSYRI